MAGSFPRGEWHRRPQRRRADAGAGAELSIGVVNASSIDKVTVLNAGGLTINGGGVRLRADGTTNPWSTPGTYNLIAYTGTLGGAASNLSVLNPVGGLTYTFGTSAGFVTLTVASAGIPNTWNTDTASTWGTGPSWTTGVPGGVGVQVNFSASSALRARSPSIPRGTVGL